MYKNSRNSVLTCNECQRMGNISRRNEIPQTSVLEVELFDILGMDFMGPFLVPTIISTS